MHLAVLQHSQTSAACDDSVGQPILAAAGFQPAPEGIGGSHMPRKSRLKGGCRQDCLPHRERRVLRDIWRTSQAELGIA
jgi:hypothetical protein